MTNRSDDNQPIPRLGGDFEQLRDAGTHDPYDLEPKPTAPDNFTADLYVASVPAPTPHSLVHQLLDVLAQEEHRPLINIITFEKRSDGSYFISVETKP